MNRWFRFYAEAMRDPKVLKLSDKDFRLWVKLLCIASENDGQIPADDDLKRVLNVRLDHLKGGVKRLLKGGLIDCLGGGYTPHGWSKRQYKSDSSTERVQKHRAKCNVSVTPPEAETDTDIKTISSEIAKAATDLWNDLAIKHSWPQVRKLTDARRGKLKARLAEHGEDGWRQALTRAAASEWLGEKPPSWFTFDFLVKNENNILKLLEGNYDKRFSKDAGKSAWID